MIDKTRFVKVEGRVETDKMWFDKNNPLKIGDSIEGKYINKAEKLGPRENSNLYVLEVKTVDGTEKVGVWGSAVLDERFEKIAKGSNVAIEYLGMKKTKDGKGEYKDFYIGVEAVKSSLHKEEIEYPDGEAENEVIPF